MAESAAGVVSALKSVAREVEFERPGAGQIHIRTDAVQRMTWSTDRLLPGDGSVRIAGMLEKVDLRTQNFRLRDVGNTIELHEVRDANHAARLIGTRVLAEGVGLANRSGWLSGLSRPAIVPGDAAVSQFRVPLSTDMAALIEAAPGSDPDGGIVMNDEEYAEFLEVLCSHE